MPYLDIDAARLATLQHRAQHMLRTGTTLTELLEFVQDVAIVMPETLDNYHVARHYSPATKQTFHHVC